MVFLTGFASDMTGAKARHLEAHCRAAGRAFVRFDYFGHGASSGDFAQGTIGRWADDAVAVLDGVTDGAQILVGSSMGGWVMLLAALARPRRIAGLIGLAAAPDFTEDLIPARLSDDQRARLDRDGAVSVPSPYVEAPTLITRTLLEEGRRHLVLRDRLPIACPVRLIHGMGDADVPWRTSLRLAEALESPDVEVARIKDGDHRLSEPADLDRLCRTLDDLASGIGEGRI